MKPDVVQVLCAKCGRVVAGVYWSPSRPDGSRYVTISVMVPMPGHRQRQMDAGHSVTWDLASADAVKVMLPNTKGAWCLKHGPVPFDWAEVRAARRPGRSRRLRFQPGPMPPEELALLQGKVGPGTLSAL